jgi:hypothetical protein
MPQGKNVSKSPLQEKRLYFLNKYTHFTNRRAYTFSIQQNNKKMKITYKIRNEYVKEI